MNKKITLLFFFWILFAKLPAQPIFSRVEIKAEDAKETRWLYSDYGKLTYSMHSGILRFEINTWLLSERMNNIPNMFTHEVMFPADSFVIRVWAIVSEDQLKPQGAMFDYAQKTIPGFVRWGTIEQSVMIDFTLLISQGVNFIVQFSQPPDERIPLFGVGNKFKPADLVIYMREAVINRTPD